MKACGGDALGYARALTRVERIRRNAPALAAAATGGSLESRIRRLVDASYRERSTGGVSAGLILLTTLFAAVLCVHAAFSGKISVPPTSERASDSPVKTVSEDFRSPAAFGEKSILPDEGFAGENDELRRIARSALGRHHGSVIIMNPQTGRLETVVNQDLAFRREWNPASTFKLVTSLAALDKQKIAANDLIDLSETAENLNLTDALAFSRNEYFGILGRRVGSEKLFDYARRFGLGRLTGVNLPGEIAGRLPVSDFGLNAGEVGIYGRQIEITPLQLAVLVSALANRGTVVRPFAGRPPENSRPAPAGLNVSPDSIAEIVAGMRSAVEKGTGRAAFNDSLAIAGKTGTAREGRDDIGLFASFAPIENPRFVVVVALREPDADGAAAAEIAGIIYRELGEMPIEN
nr:Penicillin binding protein transpeptidase domain protein [uncultured bacterium]AIA17143.1 Penicillin binding protein transpeptidase domain protein [uncultured bacterium]